MKRTERLIALLLILALTVSLGTVMVSAGQSTVQAIGSAYTSVVEPAFGFEPRTYCTNRGSPNTISTVLDWTAGKNFDNRTKIYGVCAQDKYYWVHVKFTCHEGFCFTPATKFYVNDIKATEVKRTSDYVEVWVRFQAKKNQIAVVTPNILIEEPMNGCYLYDNIKVFPIKEGGTFKDYCGAQVKWFRGMDPEKQTFTGYCNDNSIAEADQDYWAVITLFPDDRHCFSHACRASINNINENIHAWYSCYNPDDGSYRTAMHFEAPHKDYVRDVEAVVDTPLAGSLPDRNPRRSFMDHLGPRAYNIGYIDWKRGYDRDSAVSMKKGETFQAGEWYWAYIRAYPGAGFGFPWNIWCKINNTYITDNAAEGKYRNYINHDIELGLRMQCPSTTEAQCDTSLKITLPRPAAGMELTKSAGSIRGNRSGADGFTVQMKQWDEMDASGDALHLNLPSEWTAEPGHYYRMIARITPRGSQYVMTTGTVIDFNGKTVYAVPDPDNKGSFLTAAVFETISPITDLKAELPPLEEYGGFSSQADAIPADNGKVAAGVIDWYRGKTWESAEKITKPSEKAYLKIQYWAKVQFTALNGYRIRDTVKAAVINGKTCPLLELAGDHSYATFVVPVLVSRPLSLVEVILPNPSIGTYVDNSCEVWGQPRGYTAEVTETRYGGTCWEDAEVVEPNTRVYADGDIYRIELLIKADDGHMMTEDTEFKIDGRTGCEIVETGPGGRWVRVRCVRQVTAGRVDVLSSSIITPRQNDTVQLKEIHDDYGYTVTHTEWREGADWGTGRLLTPDTDHFEGGKTYWPTVIFHAKTGFTLEGVTRISINGQEAIVVVRTKDEITATLRFDVQDNPTYGTCGDHATWNLTDGVLTISGTGPMYDYETADKWPWDTMRDSVTSVVVEPGITEIGNLSLAYLDNSVSISLPEGLTRIGDFAFSYCKYTSFTIPSSVTVIGNEAFGMGRGLISIHIPANVQQIGPKPFWEYKGLQAITVDPANQWYKSVDGVLYTKDGTEMLACPEAKPGTCFAPPAGLKVLRIGAMSYADFEKIILPEGVESIEEYGFFRSKVREIWLPQSLQFVRGKAFGGATGLRTVHYGGSEARWQSTVIAEGNEPLEKAKFIWNDTNYPEIPEPPHFDDVAPDAWYAVPVNYAAVNGLMGGTSDHIFEPESPMTRAMLVTVLWRYEGQPMEGTNSFNDVPGDQWYTDAVLWAAHNGIVNGTGNGKFEPDGNITREQMAAILYRYADGKGIDITARADLSGFPDAGQVSASWALEPMQWAVAEKLIGGSDGYLLPQGNATRAQVATILMRFIQNIAEKISA